MGFYKQFFQMLYYILRCFKMVFKKKNLFFVGLIIFIVLVFCFYNNVFAADDVDLSILNNVSVGSNNTLVEDNSQKLLYFKCEPGYVYTVNFSTDRRFFYSSSLDIGSSVLNLGIISAGSDLVITGDGYFYFLALNSSSSYTYTVSRSAIDGFDNTTTKLTNEISLDNLWSVVPPTLVALGVLFAIGYIVVKKVLKRDSNAY